MHGEMYVNSLWKVECYQRQILIRSKRYHILDNKTVLVSNENLIILLQYTAENV